MANRQVYRRKYLVAYTSDSAKSTLRDVHDLFCAAVIVLHRNGWLYSARTYTTMCIVIQRLRTKLPPAIPNSSKRHSVNSARRVPLITLWLKGSPRHILAICLIYVRSGLQFYAPPVVESPRHCFVTIGHICGYIQVSLANDLLPIVAELVTGIASPRRQTN